MMEPFAVTTPGVLPPAAVRDLRAAPPAATFVAILATDSRLFTTTKGNVMKKMKLDLNDLEVESFETTEGEVGADGTVRAYHTGCPRTCDPPCTGVTGVGFTCAIDNVSNPCC